MADKRIEDFTTLETLTEDVLLLIADAENDETYNTTLRLLCTFLETIIVISASNIGYGAVTSGKLADGAVERVKLANGAVDESKLADGAVETNKLANYAVSTAKLADGAVTTEKIANGAITLAKLGNIFDPIPLEGSLKLINSGTLKGLLDLRVLASTNVSGNLATLSTLNTARENNCIYTYLLAPGTLFTNQPAAYPVKVLFVNTTQIIIGGDGYVFTRDYNSTTETWSSITCPLKDLEARVTALEAVDTILSNALNGVSE